jgi:hypothetical protein
MAKVVLGSIYYYFIYFIRIFVATTASSKVHVERSK